jgi:hypothetical protein
LQVFSLYCDGHEKADEMEILRNGLGDGQECKAAAADLDVDLNGRRRLPLLSKTTAVGGSNGIESSTDTLVPETDVEERMTRYKHLVTASSALDEKSREAAAVEHEKVEEDGKYNINNLVTSANGQQKKPGKVMMHR